MKFIVFSIAVAFLSDSLANTNVLPEPWYQSNIENYEAGVLFHSKDNEHLGFLKSKNNTSTFGSVLQHSSPKNEWLGKRIKLTASIKTIDASSAVMFMAIRHNNTEHTRDFMNDRKIKGTTKWAEYSIVLDFTYDPEQELLFGVRLHGGGEVYFKDFSFEEVERDVLSTATEIKSLRKGAPSNLNFDSLL